MSKLITLYCENCGGEIEIDDDREFCYCKYCGTKMLIPADRKFIRVKKDVNVNKKTEEVKRTVDEAEIQKQKSDQLTTIMVMVLFGATN